MQSYRVVIGMHNDLPCGASDALYEQVYQGAWRPFLSGLYKFASIKSVVHFSGAIFAWLEENHPEYMYLLTEMVRKGQVELLGGGFYNPLAGLVSAQDMTGQVEALSAFIRKTIGKRPLGAWLYEYSWTNSLPAVLQNSKIQYTMLPARCLLESRPAHSACAPVISEDHRKMVTIYPAFDSTTEDHAFQPFETTLLKLQDVYKNCGTFVMMADGCDIALSWQASGCESPDLLFERTFAWFQKNCLEYDTATTAQLYRSVKASRTAYFAQCCSERFRKYCENNARRDMVQNLEYYHYVKQAVLDHPLAHALYQKLNFVSAMTGLFRGDKSRKKASLDDIWRAQCGNLFWESPDGGILLPESRMAAYASLIDAEKTIRQNRFHHFLSVDDLNFDGVKEVLFQSALYTCYIHSQTASVSEFDSIRTSKNYACGWNVSKRVTGLFRDYICESASPSADGILVSDRWNIIENIRDANSVAFGHDFSGKVAEKSLFVVCRKAYKFENDFFSITYEIENKSQNGASFCFYTALELIASAHIERNRMAVVRHRDTEPVDIRSDFFVPAVDGVVLSDSNSTEKLTIRSDAPFFAAGNPNLIEGEGREPAMSGDSFATQPLFEGISLRIGWDLALPSEGTVLFSLSVRLEH